MKLEFVEVAGFRGFREKARLELPRGFAVLSGHNGTGKSTMLDAIDFALTGTINKFNVKEAKGGGLDEHIWWVGNGKAESYYVSVGFVNDAEERFVVTRSRESGCTTTPAEIMDKLCSSGAALKASVETLMQTTLIRDELISGLSLDLPEQMRFSLMRDAIGRLVGPDYSDRTSEILNAATGVKNRQSGRIQEIQHELGRALGELTEARSLAERSADLSEALKIIDSLSVSLPSGPAERVEAIRRLIAERRLALQQMDAMRGRLKELEPEAAFSHPEETKKEIEAARMARAAAAESKQQADERLALALKNDAKEKEDDRFAAQMSAILEHGEAVGLQKGHCPLCDTVRSQAEFAAAIKAARRRLAARGERLAASGAAVTAARAAVASADKSFAEANNRYAEFESRRVALDRALVSVRDSYLRLGIKEPPVNAKVAEELFFNEQASLVPLERAFAILETSNSMDRVKSLEIRVSQLRERADHEAAKLSAAERAVESARQIEAAAKTVANQTLMEQFDTVMPLLKELYRRLRPHADWTEIESDFGGKVRASLNFVVGDGYNPQFLFSSGQRRAAGLAFLLAIHLSRAWCNWRSLLLDDPVQHIDDYRALNLVEVLAAIRRTNRQVIVAVEDAALGELLCRRLRSESAGIGRIFELRTSRTGTAEIAGFRDIYPMPKFVLERAQAS